MKTDQTYLQWPYFTKAHQKLARDIEIWATQYIQNVPYDRADTDKICRTLVGQLGAAGWLDYAVPAATGDMADFDLRSFCLMREILARYDGRADLAFAMQALGSAPITLFGSDKQKDLYLQAIGQGKRIAAFALSEPGAGSDVGALTTFYRREDDHFVLNGRKTWISNGGIADVYIIFAREEGSRGTAGLSAFIVEADGPGLDDTSQRIDISAPHPMAEITLSNCRIGQQQLIGEAGQGFKYAMATLDIFRSSVGAAALGFARRAQHEVLGRVTERHIQGDKMSALQMIQAKIGDMATQIDASALLIYRAAWQWDQTHERITREAAMAKAFATEAAQQIVDDAVQIFGAAGVEYGHVIERLYREVRPLRIYEGATEIQRIITGRSTLSALTS
ncbi:MAG: acyl-CoA dehydrogenase [Kordiimonas sp.]|nr:acyl-CoA dehydrogenase [Kordiimonas sp.]|tara:strand:+ start:255 stop:1430 length:1176 start_codon:yes stop_codon:yes gene_type:complete